VARAEWLRPPNEVLDVPKRKRREQQHLRQEPVRRRAYQVGSTAPREIYRPGFPMNLLGNVKFFAIIGVVVGIVTVFGAVLGSRRANSNNAATLPTNTPTVESSVTTDPNATPTVNPKQFAKAEPVIDASTKKYTATVKTAKGDFTIDLFADQAPSTVNSFVFLAQKGFFDDITFHRIPTPPFVAQTGDPFAKSASTSGGPGYSTNEEPNQVKNTRGTIAMAKGGGAKSFGSQWFINLKDNPSLDYTNPADKFYPFGQVTGSGMDVVDKLVQGDKLVSITITESPK
jgi:cyclophilin family peptidyl-prolyl cis-trans isomerase